MTHKLNPAWVAAFLLLSVSLSGCGGTKMLKNPKVVSLEKPLAVAADEKLEVMLEWVVVRDGPGTWAKNADWDEYVLSARNLSGAPLRIATIAVHDSLDTRVLGVANRKRLVSGSKATVKRYKGQGLRVKAGIGGPTLMAAGAGALVTGYGVGMAAVYGASSAAAGVAVGALLAAPALVVGGVVRSVRQKRVAQEIVKRHTPLPLELAASEQLRITQFTPIAPSPQRIVVTYVINDMEYTLEIDTRVALKGMHLKARNDTKP